MRAWLNEADAAGHSRSRIWHRDSEGAQPGRPGHLGRALAGGHVLAGVRHREDNLPRLAAMLKDYGRLAEALAQVEQVCPPLLFAFLTPRREQAARRMLAGCQDAAALRGRHHGPGPAGDLPGRAGVGWPEAVWGPRWRCSGPAFVASVAYVDPGNFATNIQGGAQYGYLLLWVVLSWRPGSIPPAPWYSARSCCPSGSRSRSCPSSC